ncbi:DUF4179 domain-containing protein [Tuberibacillus sp. Marseille-P3662]|uniref:DUF4179 domain-containing protein n=1 Tax=Tuberibacillus sp. Marseille-P3662 TaxID=1965358 RepID=UPI001594A20F|nr:DUF4179 domain-containing protein [Tuberibacillus sp. Marseille-P3662]
MPEIEDRLKQEKEHMTQEDVPHELESRLRSALMDHKPKRKPPKSWTIVAVLLALILVTYNYSGLAYYGKKILGFDNVLNGTLQTLNNQGMGQTINKSYTFQNGVQLTLNGIMTDDNQTVLFYTLRDPKGRIGESQFSFSPSKLTGFFENAHVESGYGKVNDAHTQLKGTYQFAPVNGFVHELALQFSLNNETGKIEFNYDPNRALGATIEQKIDQTIKIDKDTVKLASITASPTMTVIKGATNAENIDRAQRPFSGFKVMANGQVIDSKGVGTHSKLNGTAFTLKFDALPRNVQTLQLKLDTFMGYDRLNKTIPFNSIKGGDQWHLASQSITVKGIKRNEQQTQLTISNAASVSLDNVFVGNEEHKDSLTATENQTLKKTDQDILKERTLIFKTDTTPEKLFIGGIHYMKNYHKTIDIPVKKSE